MTRVRELGPRAVRIWVVCFSVCGKVLRTFVRSPQLFAAVTLQGVLFLFVFRYVFGGAIDVGPLAYTDYMVPGIVTAGVLFSAAGAAVAVAQECDDGFVDRIRVLPASNGAALTGRVIAETAIAMWAVLVMSAAGFAVGFRPTGSPASLAAALALLIALAGAAVWTFTALGLLVRDPQAARGFAFAAIPVTFVSSAYVPIASMPGWLQWFAGNQPVTHVVDAVRGLMVADPPEMLEVAVGSAASSGLVWLGPVAAFTAMVAWHRYERG